MKARIVIFTCAVLACLFLSAADAAADARGHLFIIGGGSRSAALMKQFVALADRAGGRIVVFPMASATPEESGAGQVKEFLELGAKSAEYKILTREQAAKPDAAAFLDGAGGVYFTGGDQIRVTNALLGTPVHKALLALYEKGAVIGGTSAGAAIMTEIMITGDEKTKPAAGQEFSTLKADNVITVPGLGFLKTAIIDQHFATRKRHNRLICLVAEHPALLGIGIDESTAIVVNPEGTFDVVGEKDVLVYDPTSAKVAITPTGSIGITGMTMHVLLPGAKFDMPKKKVVTP
jgi:cyanophycinase